MDRTQLGFQPDPNDSQIFFGPCLDPRAKHSEKMTRKTVRPDEIIGNGDDSARTKNGNADYDDDQDVTCCSEEKERGSIFEPVWEHFETPSGNTTESSVIQHPFEMSKMSLDESSVLNSAFISDDAICSTKFEQVDSFHTVSRNSSLSDECEELQPLNSVFAEVHLPDAKESWVPNDAKKRIECRLDYFRKKFNIQSSTYESNFLFFNEESEDGFGSGDMKTNAEGFGDRTLAFVKEMKSASNKDGSGIPAFLVSDKSKNRVKLEPWLNETESLEKMTSTPLVIKHLRPLTMSAQRPKGQKLSGKGSHGLPVVSHINKIAQTCAGSGSMVKCHGESGARAQSLSTVYSEPVVIKRALRF